MPPETTVVVGETPAAPETPPSTPTPIPAPDEGTPGEAYDQDRAMRTIAHLREIERKAKADARELAALKATQQERADADLSEKDRAEKRATEAEAKLQQTTDAYRSRIIRLAAEGTARDLKFRDPKLAVRLLNLGAVELDDDGEPTNLPALLKAELKANPYLAEPDAPETPAGPTPISATPRPDTGRALSGAERDQRFNDKLQEVRRAYG